jgi:Mad3/BUB1 homology region 2
VNLELIYVDSEEFSFEELLAKKRGLYGLKFEVETPKSPLENIFRPAFEVADQSPENVFKPKTETKRSPMGEKPIVRRSPLQQKPVAKTPSPQCSPAPQEKLESDGDDVVYMPIRGM